ncbi:MAG: tape measure protein [Negativicutes bacterium]|nr:tape measure protein [Negativicutes bacterium]
MPGNAAMTIFIGGDNSDFLRKWDQTQKALKKGLGADAFSAANKALGALTGIVAGITAMGSAAIKMSGDMKAGQAAFSGLLGSATEAQTFLGELHDMAKNSPFAFPELTDAAKKMLSLGFAAEDVVPIIQTVGNAAALLGTGAEGIDAVTQALGAMLDKGTATTRDMRALVAQGIPAWHLLAEAIGVSVPQAMDQVNKGTISSTTAINAILTGMQEKYKGGMETMANEMPGLFTRMTESTVVAMKAVGTSLADALNVKEKMQGTVAFLDQFANYIKSNGINEALKELIPKETSLAVFTLAGALVGAAIPAMISFGISVWTALAPLLPFIAAGVALGAVAWVIWQAWEPLGDLFSATNARIVADSQRAWFNIKAIFFEGIQAILQAMVPLANIIGGSFQAQISNWMTSVSASIEQANSDIITATQAGVDAHARGEQAMTALTNSFKNSANVIGNTANKVQAAFTGLHGPDAGVLEKADKKLAAEAQRVSDQIANEWAQLTQRKIVAVDMWYEHERRKLDESAAYNENYDRDLDRLNQTYSQKRLKALADEAQQNMSIQRQIADMANKGAVLSVSIGLTGSTAKENDILQSAKDQITQIEREYQDLAVKWQGMNDQEKEITRNSLNERGILYKENADGTISLEDQAAKMRVLINKKADNDIWQYRNSGEAAQADLDAARRMGDIATYQSLLDSEKGMFLTDLQGRQQYIDAYYDAWKTTHKTSIEWMVEATNGLTSSVQSFFADALGGTKGWGDAWKSLGNSIKQVFANMAAEYIAATLKQAILGKVVLESVTSASVAAGVETAAAWAAAAAAVSLATFGANSVPAMAGMTATYALSYALSTPKLAAGGIATGPTLAMIGEGRHDEAVLPLDPRVFEKMGLTSNGKEVIVNNNNYGNINTKFDLDEWNEAQGMAVRNAIFAT